MKIKKMGLYAWALVAAMVVSMLPINAVSVKAAATKVFDAGAIEDQDVYEEKTFGDFTITASTSKHVSIAKFTAEDGSNVTEAAEDGKALGGMLKFNGASDGSQSYRMLVFETSGKATVTAYTRSNGGERALGLYDFNAALSDAGKAVALATAVAPDKGVAIAKATFEIDKAGKYYLASTSGGVNVAYVEVVEEGAAASTPAETTTPAQAETTVVPTGNTYTVQKGDTLCAIARKLFNAEAKWSDLYNWNKTTIKDPALIYIGQVLSINGETVSAPAETTKPAETTATATAAEVKNLTAKAEGYHDLATNTRMLKATLTWAAADGATSYDVYRGTEKVATVNTTSYEDTTAITATSMDYSVAVAGASNKTTTTVTSIGYDITLLQVQKDLDKVEHTPSTAPGYLPVYVQGKNDETPVTVYGKDGNKYGVNLDNQAGRYRMAEVVAMGWAENDLRAGEAIVGKEAPVVFTTEVPNGTYNVYVLCGELDHIYDGAKHKVIQQISVNGGAEVVTEAAENGAFVDTTIQADVTDGKLVVTVAGAEGKARLNGIIVTSTTK